LSAIRPRRDLVLLLSELAVLGRRLILRLNYYSSLQSKVREAKKQASCSRKLSRLELLALVVYVEGLPPTLFLVSARFLATDSFAPSPSTS